MVKRDERRRMEESGAIIIESRLGQVGLATAAWKP
jgi:hypothetical protein